MGAFELHLHEPNFTLNTGGKESALELDRSATESEDEGIRSSPMGKLGPLIVFLLVLAIAVRVRRRRE